MKKVMKTVNMIALVLLIIGGLNWAFFAFGYNLVAMLGAGLDTVVYVLVGLSAVLVAAEKLMKKK